MPARDPVQLLLLLLIEVAAAQTSCMGMLSNDAN
jgi:hypothetical protein